MLDGTEIALQRSLADVVAEYDEKRARIPAELAQFNEAGSAIKMAASIGGTFGNVSINTGSIYERTLEDSLLKSAWRHVYNGLNITRIASAIDKRNFDRAMEDPAPFTLDNIRATFGKYIADPRGNILRGLAEVFCDLDPAYKSHDKVKIGVKGLPKRIILTSVGGYGSYGRDRLENVLNALASYQGKPLVTYAELEALLKDETALLADGEVPDPHRNKRTEPDKTMTVIGRGVRLRRFHNGNGHLFFEPDTLRDINMALAEFYGDVLPDTPDEKAARPKGPGTGVAKDLQYFPTPEPVVERVMRDAYLRGGERVLEPSCGCGRFLRAIRAAGASPFGIEVDAARAEGCKAEGFRVLRANFLEVPPVPEFDQVIMNPPFYGKHYAKHVRHALRFLKPGGKLTAILPATARYDHGLLDDLQPRWSDLPVGSFAESGTNISTTVMTVWAPKD